MPIDSGTYRVQQLSELVPCMLLCILGHKLKVSRLESERIWRRGAALVLVLICAVLLTTRAGDGDGVYVQVEQGLVLVLGATWSKVSVTSKRSL